MAVKWRNLTAPWQKKGSVIGIDIGADSVKGVEMRRCAGGRQVVRAAVRDINRRLGKGNREAAVAAVREALSEFPVEQAEITACLGGAEVLTFRILVPPMPRQELLEAIRWEVGRHVHFPIDQAVWDYRIQGEAEDKGARKWNLLVAVSPRRDVDSCLGIFSQAGLKNIRLIPSALAVQQILPLFNVPSLETTAVLNMGASGTEIIFFENGQMVFSRKLPLSGEAMTESLTGTLTSAQGRVQLSREEAEHIKKICGIPNEKSRDLIEGKILPSQIVGLIRPQLESLVDEIERSFTYYREGMKGGHVDRIFLLGGMANLKGLKEFLRRELDMDIICADFSSLFKEQGKGEADSLPDPRLGLALGAAMADPREGINLLPAEIKEQTKTAVKKVSGKALAAAFVTVSMLFYAGLQIQASVYKKRQQAALVEQQALTTVLKEVQEKVMLAGIVHGKPLGAEVLKEISNVIPGNMVLTQMELAKDTVILKGRIVQAHQSVEATLSQFMLALEEGLFKNVRLVTTQKSSDGPQSSYFEITCEVE